MNYKKDSKWIKDSIRELSRLRDAPVQRTGMFRMDRNERTWPFSNPVMEEIRSRITSETLTNYPEMDDIYHKLANYLKVDSEQLYFHSGSDLVIKSIFETYIGKGDKVIMPNPCYAMYGVYARMQEAKIHEVDYDSDLHFDIDAYCYTIEAYKPKLVIFENPSGYIGNSFSHEDVEKIIQSASSIDALAVVDEAYIDYIQLSSVQDLIPQYDNLIIVRTFSKAWGLAGMRAGYALSNELLISEIFKVMPMHELTSASVIAVDTVLNHAKLMQPYIEAVSQVREYFLLELDKMGIRAIKSDTHFVTAAIGEKLDADDFRQRANENRFFVRRPFGQEMLKNWVRIGLLPMNDMKSFVLFMKDYIRDVGYL